MLGKPLFVDERRRGGKFNLKINAKEKKGVGRVSSLGLVVKPLWGTSSPSPPLLLYYSLVPTPSPLSTSQPQSCVFLSDQRD